jgi:GNAT superfamily N-acetyltransferase
MSARDYLSKYQFGEPDIDANTGMIEARTAARGNYVGHILWDTSPGPSQGMVTHIFTRPGHRHRGVATEMYNRAKAADPAVRHSNVRTPKGDKWAASTGDYMPPNEGYREQT